MSAYDHDPRVQPDPLMSDNYWLVDPGNGYLFNVAEGDDGLYYAFWLIPHLQSEWIRHLGDLMDHITGDDFDTVVGRLLRDYG